MKLKLLECIRPRVALALAGILTPSPLAAQTDTTCREAVIAEPATRSIVADARPLIRWEAIPGATSYRVEIESRVPEGRVLVALDTVANGTTFRPPRALTDYRGAVKLRISSGCPVDDGSALREKGAWFLIDTSSLCPIPGPLTFSPDKTLLTWPPTPGALRYDISLRQTNGDPRAEAQTKEPRYPLPPDGRPYVAIVRPYCPGGFGPRVPILVTP